MNTVLDRLKKKAMDIIVGMKTLDELANLDLGKALFGVSDSGETKAQPASAPKARRRVIPKRKNRKVKLTKEMSDAIYSELKSLTSGTDEYFATRDRLCKEYGQSRKTVSGVLQGHKVWTARQAKGATSIGNGKRGTRRRSGKKR